MHYVYLHTKVKVNTLTSCEICLLAFLKRKLCVGPSAWPRSPSLSGHSHFVNHRESEHVNGQKCRQQTEAGHLIMKRDAWRELCLYIWRTNASQLHNWLLLHLRPRNAALFHQATLSQDSLRVSDDYTWRTYGRQQGNWGVHFGFLSAWDIVRVGISSNASLLLVITGRIKKEKENFWLQFCYYDYF